MILDLIIRVSGERHAAMVNAAVGSKVVKVGRNVYDVYAELIGENTLGIVMTLGTIVSVRPVNSWNSI
jgi:hypothetical protein